MKRTWIAALLVLLAILSAMPAAAYIGIMMQMHTPVANENLEIGVPALITWTWVATGGKGETFKIFLMQNNIAVGIIAEELSFPYSLGTNKDGHYWISGRYVWKTGTFAGGVGKPGTGYSVKIQIMSNSFSAFGSSFTLSAPPRSRSVRESPLSGTSITITSPKATGVIWRSNIFNVKWNIQGKMDPNVSVALLDKGVFVVTLAASTPNNGTFNYDNYNTYPFALSALSDGMYTVRVRTVDRGVEAVSGEFQLATPPK